MQGHIFDVMRMKFRNFMLHPPVPQNFRNSVYCTRDLRHITLKIKQQIKCDFYQIRAIELSFES